MTDQVFRCETCQKESAAAVGGETPICCGRPMAAKLEACTKPFDAETARPDASDEPCSDGRGGDR